MMQSTHTDTSSTMGSPRLACFLLLVSVCLTIPTTAFVPHSRATSVRPIPSLAQQSGDDLPDFELPEEEEAEKLQQQAEKLRKQIQNMEADIQSKRQQRMEEQKIQSVAVQEDTSGPPTLKNKRILVAGANGRLGSMVCRYLLRNHPEIKECLAMVHTVGEQSSRGYGRLSYEVGAEDGVGQIGPAWSSSDERVASFQYDPNTMQGYNLNKLRVVECELLDPVQCQTITKDVDAIIWCATDFNGNAPRAVSGLDFAFLFRAVASPTKGRVEIEGLENLLGALKLNKKVVENDPTHFVCVSMVPEAYPNYETPFGEFNAIKRQSESILQNYPSLSSTVLQLGKFEDNFVEEGLPIAQTTEEESAIEEGKRRLINRRDAAKAAVDALLNTDIKGKITQVYTAKR